jgi:hypothetical protein
MLLLAKQEAVGKATNPVEGSLLRKGGAPLEQQRIHSVEQFHSWFLGREGPEGT